MKELTIGKLPDNILVINHGMVSRHHAKIVMDRGGRFEIIDLESKNGTYVNGRKVRGSQAVRPGDRIVFATSPIPSGWERMFDQIPDDEPDPTLSVQPGSTSIDPSMLSSVLYDFNKDVDALFSKQHEHLKQIIIDFKDNRLPSCRPSAAKQFSEEILDLLVERYDFVGKQISLLLGQLDRESQSFQAEYSADMQKLDKTYQYYLNNSKSDDLISNLGRVETRKGEMKQHYEELCKAVLPMVNAIIEDYYAQNPPLFTRRLELAPANSQLWKTLPSPDDEIQKTFYLGEDVTHYNILQQPVELKKRVYVQSLYGGNLLFRYANKHRQACFDAVNTLISRMLAATPAGKMQVVMVDTKEMEGTSGAFNSLNKSVFKVVSRSEDFTTMLNEALSHTENIIQNLLQGDITNISENNRTKNEKHPYTLWVLKDIPTGRGNDFNEKLLKILRNGPRAGVSVLVLLDEQYNGIDISSTETCYFTSGSTVYKPSDSPQITLPELFSTDIVSSIVKKVNQALEVKTKTKLKFSEYMLPEKDWWKGESAERIDIPFGLTKDGQTTALQFTQENAQNVAVVIGKSGSGKSAFLHTIIASAVTHYSPKELQLYLIDFSGVEFSIYAKNKLPHACVIAQEAEREFGLSVLDKIYQVGQDRMKQCNDNGDVSDIISLKRKRPDLVVPRLLVIIDEFQKLFEVDNDEISQKAKRRILTIIKEYRKFGINLILATQQLPFTDIVPYNLINNRIVFESDPSEFDKLTGWPYALRKPQFSSGVCVYNNRGGAEDANQIQRTFYIDKDNNEREDILEKINAFAKNHSDKMDNHEILVSNSRELPEFSNRKVIECHKERHKIPREMGVYLGENIAISHHHLFIPLTHDSNNNILIIGGDHAVSIGIAYHSLLSVVSEHAHKSCHVFLVNFMIKGNPLSRLFESKTFDICYEACNMVTPSNADIVKKCLQGIKKTVEARKDDPSVPRTHFFISIFEFQRGRMFDGMGDNGDMESECSILLKYILKNGPQVGVFTLLQVDNLSGLQKIDNYNALDYFCHRVALQMTEKDSEAILNRDSSASLLQNQSSYPRGIYYNSVNERIMKFKPYQVPQNEE